MPIDVRQFPCLSDNYGFLVRDRETGLVAAIDTPDADAVDAELEKAGWRLTHILNTHHHPDHAGGNEALKKRWNCEVVAPADEAERIPGVDRAVREGDRVVLGESEARVIETPGHTSGHIVYHFEADAVAFVGDTLFAMGCGRLFEGTPAQMWKSLSKLAALPDETTVYCAHEYTQANARFALSVDAGNPALVARAAEVDRLRETDQPTVPTTIAAEKATNPFLRAEDPALMEAVGAHDAVSSFAEIRRRKDSF